MEKIDACTHSPQVQYEIRKQVIRLRKQGLSNKTVAQGVGISVYHASRIWQSYKKGGSKAIAGHAGTPSQAEENPYGGSGERNSAAHY